MAHKFPEVTDPAERSQIAIDLRHMKRELRSLEKRLNEDQDWINMRFLAVRWEIIGYTNAILHTARARMAASGHPFWSVKAFYNPDYKFGVIEKCFVGPGSYQKATDLYEYLKARAQRYDAVYLRQSRFTRYDTTKLLQEKLWETEGFILRTKANNYDEPWDDDDWQDDHDPSEFRTCETCGGEFWPGGSSCVCDSTDKTSYQQDDKHRILPRQGE